MKNLIYYFFILFVSCIIYSCGGSGAQTHNYQDPAFDTYVIKTIAILPVRNSSINIGEAKEINRYFISGLDRKNKKYTLIGPDEAIEKMTADSLVEKYYNYLNRYSTTGISDAALIREICSKLGADAIVQGEIYDVIKRDGQYGGNKGETRCKLRYSLLSAKDGKTVWETTAEAYETTTTTLEDAPPLMRVIMVGMDKILESIPQSK